MENICPNPLHLKEVKTKRLFGQDISNKPDIKKTHKELLLTTMQGSGAFMEKDKNAHYHLDQSKKYNTRQMAFLHMNVSKDCSSSNVLGHPINHLPNQATRASRYHHSQSFAYGDNRKKECVSARVHQPIPSCVNNKVPLAMNVTMGELSTGIMKQQQQQQQQGSSTCCNSSNTSMIVEEKKKPVMASNVFNENDDGQISMWDQRTMENPQECGVYAGEILKYIRKIQTAYRPSLELMKFQEDINQKMRRILFDWIIQVHYKFKLRPSTLYLTQNIVDRFLSISKVKRQKLQLIGVTSLFIASKYQEIYAPDVNDLVYITDYAYKKEQILSTEIFLLCKLHHNVTVPNPHEFLLRWSKVANASKVVENMASMMIDASIIDFKSCVGNLPSKISAAALYVALNIEKGIRGMKASGSEGKTGAWNSDLMKESGYEEGDLISLAGDLYKLIKSLQNGTSREVAIMKKYKDNNFNSVSLIKFE